MRQKRRHLVLEARLQTLAARIETLKRQLARAKGVERVEELGEIEELESRRKKLTDRLRELDREGPGLRQDLQAELEAMADDLSAAVEDFMIWADSGEASRREPRKR
jgi:predicted  nucleic acid-binding Zn-ribbon protein